LQGSRLVPRSSPQHSATAARTAEAAEAAEAAPCSRRGVASALVAALTSGTAAGSADADVGSLPPPGIPKWWGAYKDPLHANCKMYVEMSEDGLAARISGYEGEPDCTKVGFKKKPFEIYGKLKTIMDEEMYVDFSTKGGSKEVKVEYEGNGIRLPTGSKWFKVGKTEEFGYKPLNMTLTGPEDKPWRWR